MMDPICLVENDNEILSVNQKALQILEKISQPVVVVAIVGLYRTGKSYLMNRLAGQNHGFPLGSTVQSETKGIWMWCVPHPSKENHTLVLLDTEGLGDVEKRTNRSSSMMLSRELSGASPRLRARPRSKPLSPSYVTELTELIQAKSSPRPDGVEDSAEFVSFFPDFIWAVRDFTLELKLNGHPITEDQYLENALKLIPGKNPKARTSNLPRECIRHFFPTRKCFVFDWPTNEKELLYNIENVSEDQLDPKFLEQTNNFCSYIFTNAKIKTLKEGIMVTGNRLRTLVVTYVDTINTGAVPCLENAVTTLAQLENSAAVQKAADHYSEQMAQRLRLPTDTLQELLEVHAACEREAIAIFMDSSFKDKDQEFQRGLVEVIKNKKEGFMLQNEEASIKYCQAKLDALSKALMESISAGAFSVPGGHKLYRKAMDRLQQGYCQVPRKGVKENEVLQSFLQSQVAVEKSILQADKALTEGEKAVAEERARNETAEKEQELLRQKLQEQQQEMEAQERSLQENIAQLTEKLARERENLLREQTMMLEHKLKAQEALLKEGFRQKSENMSAEINHLRNMIDNTNDAEQYEREAAKREKDSLEQKIKELIQMLENQERAFKIFRVKITGETRERDNLLRRMNKRIEMLEILRKIREEQEKYYMKKEEQIKREASEREKDPSERKVEELQRQLENQKGVLERLRARVRKQMREREKTSAEYINEEFRFDRPDVSAAPCLQMLGMIKDELGECCKKTDELCDAAKTLAEECVKRVAAEREKELLEQKVKELQEQLEDQERVPEELRVKKTEKRREREKTSAEMLSELEVAMQEKKLLEQMVKKLKQKLKDQERTFERFRDKLTKEMRKRDDLLRKMNERIQMLERLLRLPETLEEQDMKKEEQTEREAAEREKEYLEKQVKELEQNVEDQERVFQRLRTEMTEEMRESEKASAEEQIKREAAEREKESAEKQVKELEQNVEDQERVFQRLRTEMTEEMRESEKASAEEQAKRKAAEREKLLEQRLKELQQKFEDQERAFKAFRVQMTEEERERDYFLRKMNKRIEMLEAAVNNDNDKDDEENTEKYWTS
ncbi:hypothetical protein MG293_001672 [Ovis ammon polii]|uniref:GB1/RHD3-type G domain-containing protein n=1 Tax=Ovis ammon polii TaxID=230172 RepID=A0AAD4YJ08_OVIAM|nr:hypothetical protein MG293_001672 [Ovis ammon polii]